MPYVKVNTNEINPGWRVRSNCGDVEGLKQSIQTTGQLHPILVKKDAQAEYPYLLIAGFRRLLACKELGIKVIASVITDLDELRELAVQLEENTHRKDFDTIELAEGLKRYKALYEKANPDSTWGANLKKSKRDAKGRITDEKTKAIDSFAESAAKSLNTSLSTIYTLLSVASLSKKEKQEALKAKTTRERNVAVRKIVSKLRREKKVAKLEERARTHKVNKEDECGIQFRHADYKVAIEKDVQVESIDLVLTDPPYNLSRKTLIHAERSNIAEDVTWDNLEVGWVLDVVPYIRANGSLITFCALELVGLYELIFRRAELVYKGCIVWHKCVSEETLIPVVTEDGLHRLRPSEIRTGDRIISVGAGGEALLAKVMSTERMGCRESLVRVTLADGNTAAVTPDHRIPTRGGKLVEAGKLGVGDEVLVATTFPLEEPGSGYKEDRELGRIAGIWLGDGGFSSSRASRVEFHLSRAKAETVGFLEEALPRFFEANIGRFEDRDYTTDPPGPIGSGQGIRLYSHNDALRSFLGGVFAGVSAQTKRIRPQTFMRGREFLQGMVDGFCETDGAWDELNHRWRFNQGSAELLRDFSILLKVLGLPSKLYPPRTVADGFTAAMHTCWPMEFRPEISRHHNSVFKDEARGVCPVKVAKIEAAPGGVVWDLAVDSDSHLFTVDHGMLVHNSNPAPAHRPVYAPSCEAIVWATRGDAYTFVPFENAGSLEAHNFMEGPVCAGAERLNHPTQKPLWLMKRLLERHTVKDNIVLDPFAGVGTTLVACKQLGLSCFGYEKESKYVKQGLARLKVEK